MMSVEQLKQRVLPRLAKLYPGKEQAAWLELEPILQRFADRERKSGWDERDVVLITYGDMVRQPHGHALDAQRVFLLDHSLNKLISTVHLLPFCPYSSDDGFSVIDYRAVDDRVGDWNDVEAMTGSFDLMFDLVLNHCSQHSEWFQGFLASRPPFENFFITADPNDARLADVTRPRSLPLLTEFERDGETIHVWTTFSADQVDLNFAEPKVLAEMVGVFLHYAERGARIVRLDAIAYLWKELGTSCIHLDETHEVVKLMRDVVDCLAPGLLILTETNVPHRENVSYFGNGDEAQMVYQFSLPPLLADAFTQADAKPLNTWLANLEPAAEGCAYFNFTASHDGIGVRPLEGLVDDARLQQLVQATRDRGGRVGMRRNPDSSDSPYELNITYWDILGSVEIPEAEHAQRFLTSQAVMLSLRGIPGVYFHSLVGTPNDQQGVEESGIPRRINRHKYIRDELNAKLAAGTTQRAVFDGYQRLLKVRAAHASFHPDAKQDVLSEAASDFVAVLRTSENERVLCLANVTRSDVQIDLDGLLGETVAKYSDLLSGRDGETGIDLAAGSAAWLVLN